MRKYSKAGTTSIGKLQPTRKFEDPNASYPSNYLKSLQAQTLLSGNFDLTSPKKGMINNQFGENLKSAIMQASSFGNDRAPFFKQYDRE